MTFIDAVLAIARRPEFTLCEDEGERDGIYPSVCVYRDSVFVGKLRWPQGGHAAEVDPILARALAPCG